MDTYEKKYKEALERARVWKEKSGMPKDKQGILDDIFPELRESEDEKIRKELLTFFRESIHGGHILTNKEYDSWIAWLEKQGYTKKDVDNAYLKGICNTKHELEKQGDQKSVDKEYTFKSIPRLLDMIEPMDRAKSYCKKLIDSLQTEGYSVDAKIVGECLKQMNGEKVAMAVMDTEKQDEQKPQRMVSAEAKEAMYDKPADSYCQENCKGFQETGKCFADEDCEAKREAEQKPAWSEEDEERIKNIISVLDWDGEAGKKGNPYHKEVEWLKSLKDRVQPQSNWKPSEEQIKALNAINVTGNISYAGQGQVLIALYNDLLKLKE